jgi:hypothetical protein
LVEEDILSIAAFSREVLEVPVLTDTMLLTKLLPDLASNYRMSIFLGAMKKFVCFKRTAIAALACLDGNDFSVSNNTQLMRRNTKKNPYT